MSWLIRVYAMERDTRFSYDDLKLACSRLNALKDEIGLGDECVLLERLGWAPMAVMELTEEIVRQIIALEHCDLRSMIATAWVDGALLGGIAADISYEKKHGL